MSWKLFLMLFLFKNNVGIGGTWKLYIGKSFEIELLTVVKTVYEFVYFSLVLLFGWLFWFSFLEKQLHS